MNGHPDPRPSRFCSAICEAYASGLRNRGIGATRIDVSGSAGRVEADIVRHADSMVLVFPLWLDRPPESVRAFFDDTMSQPPPPLRRTHIVVTMDMPAFMHRSAAASRTPDRCGSGVFDLRGLSHATITLIGTVSTMTNEQRANWLSAMQRIGEKSDVARLLV
ncbi:MAG: hypothetical protein ABSD74_05440 [Rhizomicrobium sp.]